MMPKTPDNEGHEAVVAPREITDSFVTVLRRTRHVVEAEGAVVRVDPFSDAFVVLLDDGEELVLSLSEAGLRAA